MQTANNFATKKEGQDSRRKAEVEIDHDAEQPISSLHSRRLIAGLFAISVFTLKKTSLFLSKS